MYAHDSHHHFPLGSVWKFISAICPPPNSSIPNKTITPSYIILYKTFSQNKSQSSIFPSILCVCTPVWFPNPSLFMEPLHPPWYLPIYPPFSHALHIRYTPPYFTESFFSVSKRIYTPCPHSDNPIQHTFEILYSFHVFIIQFTPWKTGT